jgi:hypothetical protein
MFGNFIACRLDGLPVRGQACRRCLSYGVRTRTQAPVTASEAILISSSSSEVKPETHGVQRPGKSESAVSEREREALTQDRGVVLARFSAFPLARARFLVDVTYVTGVVAFARLPFELR